MFDICVASCRVLKEIQNWKEAPLDCMILSLYQLQTFYFKEINRDTAGLGEYSIASAYKDILVIPIDYLLTGLNKIFCLSILFQYLLI